MPFKSKSQLRTCFSKEIKAKSKGQKWEWNCKEWLKETRNVNDLPEKCCQDIHSSFKKSTNNISPIYKGKRGGHYFYVGNIKIYVPNDKKSIAYATTIYGKN